MLIRYKYCVSNIDRLPTINAKPIFRRDYCLKNITIKHFRHVSVPYTIALHYIYVLLWKLNVQSTSEISIRVRFQTVFFFYAKCFKRTLQNIVRTVVDLNTVEHFVSAIFTHLPNTRFTIVRKRCPPPPPQKAFDKNVGFYFVAYEYTCSPTRPVGQLCTAVTVLRRRRIARNVGTLNAKPAVGRFTYTYIKYNMSKPNARAYDLYRKSADHAKSRPRSKSKGLFLW